LLERLLLLRNFLLLTLLLLFLKIFAQNFLELFAKVTLFLDLARLYFILVFKNSTPFVEDVLIIDWQVS